MSLTANLDKATYNPGDTMTLTVVSDKRLQSTALDIQSAGDDAKVTTTVQAGVTVTDPSGRKWTVKSDDGHTAIYTSTA